MDVDSFVMTIMKEILQSFKQIKWISSEYFLDSDRYITFKDEISSIIQHEFDETILKDG
jgi:hypothetical protein